MAIFKCKMCGGDLDVHENSGVAECLYCGTIQTLPKIDDDKRRNLYDRANHFRQHGDFDKAMTIYEQILSEDNTDAEAYWSLVLCRYGIEYVEDPTTHKRVPTVNRTQPTPLASDEDYKSALHYANDYQRSIYEAEAKAIDEIQREILAVSQREEPFDVFICYKETDAAGQRTPDSVLAVDLHNQLMKEGFRGFCAKITLEDKLGKAYEPYIFAALNSAPVMVALGTKAEYFNAPWVRNEWSRYLTLIKSGAKKTLIPAYKDMSPYDLPDEFAHLQAQDMGKLGFMQDLIRGIKKILDADKAQPVVTQTVVTTAAANSEIEPLLKRAFMFLEDGDWGSANEYCERVLDKDPENARAYLGKLMADLKVRRQEELKNVSELFSDNKNYIKAVRFADDALKSMLTEADKEVMKEVQYKNGLIYMMIGKFASALECFNKLSGYRDADKKVEELRHKAYDYGIKAIAKRDYSSAINSFQQISGYRDTDEKIEELRPKVYDEGIEVMAKGKYYSLAIECFKTLSGYRDADEKVEELRPKVYDEGIKSMAYSLYFSAMNCFKAISGYRDADEKVEELRPKVYENGMKDMTSEAYASAIHCFEAILEYSDVGEKIEECCAKIYDKDVEEMAKGNYMAAIGSFIYISGYRDTDEKFEECCSKIYADGVEKMARGEYVAASGIFRHIDGYRDAGEKVEECYSKIYDEGIAEMKKGGYGNYVHAMAFFALSGGYRDSQEKYEECKRWADEKKSAPVNAAATGGGCMTLWIVVNKVDTKTRNK